MPNRMKMEEGVGGVTGFRERLGDVITSVRLSALMLQAAEREMY